MTSSALTLAWQRRMTVALINDDPTTAALIPQARTQTATGGFTDTPLPARPEQTFKLSLMGYDVRPEITVAGVARLMDYHLIGRYDMEIAVGDFWIDNQGTRFTVAAFSEGFAYMTKAMVYREVPRGANIDGA